MVFDSWIVVASIDSQQWLVPSGSSLLGGGVVGVSSAGVGRCGVIFSFFVETIGFCVVSV